MTYVAGGIAVVGLAFTTGFAIARASAIGPLDNCKGSCSASAVEGANNDLWGFYASLAVTLASGGYAAYTYLGRPAASRAQGSTGVTGPAFDLAIGPLPGGAFAGVRAAF
jgi:hypothetical protein